MKNLLLSLIFSLSFFTINAQAPSNVTVYDCTTASRNIYNTLGTGKSVIIMSKGVDCSICMSVAPGWQTYALDNKSTVEVWAAMTYTYNPATFSASCAATDKWVADYGWSDIFAFPDSSRAWYQSGTPRYYVYSAIDSTITYQGSSSAAARSNAIAQSVVGLKNVFKGGNIQIAYTNNQVRLNFIPEGINGYKMFDINGRLLEEATINNKSLTIESTSFKKGIYLLQLLEKATPVGQTKIMLF